MGVSLMLRSLVHFEFAFNWKVPGIEVPSFPYCVTGPSTILFKDTILPVGLSWHGIWKVPELIGVAVSGLDSGPDYSSSAPQPSRLRGCCLMKSLEVRR